SFFLHLAATTRLPSFPTRRSSDLATVKDFVDSHEYLRPLATVQGDLKDVQRPWAVKAILANVPRGGRVLEIGAGQPFVADLLARDRKSTRLNSSHRTISYAVFCLK